eukprot:8177358-Heterocapsa_arctica.AAC.1
MTVIPTSIILVGLASTLVLALHGGIKNVKSSTCTSFITWLIYVVSTKSCASSIIKGLRNIVST